MHKESKPYGKRPYSYHLEMVVEVAKRFGFTDPDIIGACYAHDVIEDTQICGEDLLRMGFPPEVVRLTELVTDEPGANRDEKKAATYPKIRTDKKAVIIKLCDRIANVEHSNAAGDSMLKRYRREHPEFTKQLRRPEDGLENMWAHLDKIIGV
jgi:(p)ppGpp synthase/HD superfamily hydrolase